MAQSNVTVTPDGPTPPTNFGEGMIGMRPPTTPGAAFADDGAADTVTEFASPAMGGVAAEGASTEVMVTAPGSRAECPTVSVSTLGNYTSHPNGDHASSLSPSSAGVISGLSPPVTASGAGTAALTVNGANFTKQSIVHVDGVAQTTVFVHAGQLTVAAAPKKATAGTLPVTVVTGGVTTPVTNWNFT